MSTGSVHVIYYTIVVDIALRAHTHDIYIFFFCVPSYGISPFGHIRTHTHLCMQKTKVRDRTTRAHTRSYAYIYTKVYDVYTYKVYM